MSIHKFFAPVLRYGTVALMGIAIVACGGGKDDGANTSDAKGAGAAADGNPVKGDWLVIHALSDPENLNYITSNDASSQEMHNLMYESLTTNDWETLERMPVLADSLPIMSADRLSYEFRLRKDATFADGKPVTGHDFIFYLKALKNPLVINGAPLRSYYTRVDRVELIDNDPYRLRVVMNEPYYLGEQWAGGLLALPKHIWDPKGLTDKMTFDQLNKGDSTNPAIKEFADWFQDIQKGMSKEFLIGSGPYVFEEWRRNQQVVFVRNDKYWNKDPKYGQAFPDRIIFRSINDPNAALATLKNGEIDFIPIMEKILYQRNKEKFADYSLEPAEYDYPSYTYIGYNQLRPLFKDKLVRQALAHAIDRESIIKSIYFGMARPIQSPVLVRRPEYDSSITTIGYDLEKAKSLLTQAGWSDSDGDGILDKVIDGKKTPFKFTVLLNSGNQRRQSMALVFVQALKKIGIDASTQTLDWAVYLERTRNKEFDAAVSGWAMSVVEGDMYQIWHSESAGEGGSNHVSFKNPRVDELLTQIRSEFDFEKRKVMYREIQKIINDEQPYNFLVTEKMTGAHHNRFRNTEFYAPRPCYYPAWWWVPQQAQKYTQSKPVASAN